MKKALLIASVLFVAVISTACINNMAVQELNNKAAEYMQKGDYESAINRLQASLDLDATMYETYYNLGIASINANQYEKAIEAIEAGIKVKPDFANFYYSLAVAQSDLAEKKAEGNPGNLSAGEKNAEIVLTDTSQELTEETQKEIIKFKENAIKNFQKYLSMEPNATDKEYVQHMIVELENFIKNKTTKAEE